MLALLQTWLFGALRAPVAKRDPPQETRPDPELTAMRERAEALQQRAEQLLKTISEPKPARPV